MVITTHAWYHAPRGSPASDTSFGNSGSVGAPELDLRPGRRWPNAPERQAADGELVAPQFAFHVLRPLDGGGGRANRARDAGWPASWRKAASRPHHRWRQVSQPLGVTEKPAGGRRHAECGATRTKRRWERRRGAAARRPRCRRPGDGISVDVSAGTTTWRPRTAPGEGRSGRRRRRGRCWVRRPAQKKSWVSGADT